MGLLELLEQMGITNVDEYKDELKVDVGKFKEEIEDYFDF